MTKARVLFDDTFKPAVLLLGVYRLLENEGVETTGERVERLRELVGAGKEEELFVIWNEVFLGLVREAAGVRSGTVRRNVLNNLLRQAVVCACTAMETYLQILLEENLSKVIRFRGAGTYPRNKDMFEYFRDFNLGLDGALGLINGESDPYGALGRKLLGYFKYKNLGSDKALSIAGMMLGLESPWREIAARLGRDQNDLVNSIRNTFKRRNDIVHRGDRGLGQETGPRQEITYEWTKQAVETIENVCMALGELVRGEVEEIDRLAGRIEKIETGDTL